MIRRNFLHELKKNFERRSLIRKHVLAVLRVYDHLQAHIERLKGKTDLRCVEGCGRCCDNPRVEASVLECLPLAAELWVKGQAPETLKILEQAENKPCVFFKRDPLVEGHGRCTVYPYRPLVCRLYGFSANRDKQKNPIFVGCPMIREAFPRAYESAENLAETNAPQMPSMSDYGARIAAADPDLSKKTFNINHAVREALLKVGLHMEITRKGRL